MIADDDGGFYFLEMNTRLQVEHPVTEAVTGIDIVEQQVRIAAGEPLSFGQDDVHFNGHAIEARVYAEDADAGFLPATGRLGIVRFPAGDGLRVDHGVVEGQEVTASFDPMIAKVIAHAATREEAIERLRSALAATVLLGVITNTSYLERVLASPSFKAGDTHTGFLDEHRDALAPRALPAELERCLVAAAALASPRFDPRLAAPEPLSEMGEWRP
jgi:acetyl/propionyl-CoA carboxylase alpha subunit